MTIDRRGFIGAILALGVAPAIVRADSLMRIVDRDAWIVVRVPVLESNAGAVWLGALSGFERLKYSFGYREVTLRRKVWCDPEAARLAVRAALWTNSGLVASGTPLVIR